MKFWLFFMLTSNILFSMEPQVTTVYSKNANKNIFRNHENRFKSHHDYLENINFTAAPAPARSDFFLIILDAKEVLRSTVLEPSITTAAWLTVRPRDVKFIIGNISDYSFYTKPYVSKLKDQARLQKYKLNEQDIIFIRDHKIDTYFMLKELNQQHKQLSRAL